MDHINTKTLTLSKLSKNIIDAKYAVRGSIVTRAMMIKNDLQHKPQKYPFDTLYMCNIGNPQELGQLPNTYMRQVISSALYPTLLQTDIIPKDVKKRVEKFLHPRSHVGAYTHSQGIFSVRKNVAHYLNSRDNFYSDPENIFLTDGATPSIKNILRLLIASEKDGIMIPVPSYPLYSASITIFGGISIGYNLEEGNDWQVDTKKMNQIYEAACKENVTPRAICVINPGNPTGQVMSYDSIREIINFAHERRMLIVADEVYNFNVYGKSKVFYSFRRVLNEMGEKYKSQELVSVDSVSKGLYGECGLRGGFTELLNIEPDVKQMYLKLSTTSLCSNIVGQIAIDVMINPPKESDESYPLFNKEMTSTFESLKRRADKISARLSNIKGIKCNKVGGALYAFPEIFIPKKAIEEAENRGIPADEMYCIELLESTGICTVPGSGFGQEENTHHFRLTILPPEEVFDTVLDSLEKFHLAFLDRYGDK